MPFHSICPLPHKWNTKHFQDGMTHGFVAEFEHEEHRDYYAFQDPVHLALGVKLVPLVERCVVLDFVHRNP